MNNQLDASLLLTDDFSMLLPISDQARNFGMAITEISYKKYQFGVNDTESGNHEVKSDRWNVDLVLDTFQLYFISSGEAFFKTYDFQGMVKDGVLLLIPPREKFLLQPNLTREYEEFRFSFLGSIPESWQVKKFLPAYVIPMEVKYKDPLLNNMFRMISIARKEIRGTQPMLSSILIEIISEYYSQYDASLYLLDKKEDPLYVVKLYFEENLYTKFSIEDMCDKLHMNYYQLRNYFKEQTGMSPYQYLLEMKIDKAREMLRVPEASVKEVAFRLAFDSPYYFSRLFKKKTGISPTKWIDSSDSPS